MPRQILDSRPEHGEAPDARRCRIATGLGQMLRQELLGILIAPVRDELREPVAHVARKPERLTDLARRAATAIRDDVRRHSGAEPAVAAIDVLDDRFAPVAARQIEVDVGPLVARLAEKTFEK